MCVGLLGGAEAARDLTRRRDGVYEEKAICNAAHKHNYLH